MSCITQRRRGAGCLFVMAVRAGLWFRFYFGIVVAGLATLFCVILDMFFMRELIGRTCGMVAGCTKLFIYFFLMICRESGVKFCNVAGAALRRSLLIAGSVVAGPAIVSFNGRMRLMGKNDFTSLVVEKNSHRRCVGRRREKISDGGRNEECNRQSEDREITFFAMNLPRSYTYSSLIAEKTRISP